MNGSKIWVTVIVDPQKTQPMYQPCSESTFYFCSQSNSTTLPPLPCLWKQPFCAQRKRKKKVKLLLTFENDTHLVAFILYHIHSFFFKCTEAHNMNIAVLN